MLGDEIEPGWHFDICPGCEKNYARAKLLRDRIKQNSNRRVWLYFDSLNLGSAKCRPGLDGLLHDQRVKKNPLQCQEFSRYVETDSRWAVNGAELGFETWRADVVI